MKNGGKNKCCIYYFVQYIFDCAKVEQLQANFRFTLNILHYLISCNILPILLKDHTVLIKSDIKTHFKLNIKKCALCTSSTPYTVSLSFLFQYVLSDMSAKMLDFNYT